MRWIKTTLKVFVLIILLLFISIAIFLNFAPTFGAAPKGKSLARIKASPNFRDGRFRNLVKTPMDTSSPDRPNSLGSFLNPPPGKLPTVALPSLAFELEKLTPGKFVWFGHSTVLFNTGGKMILTDPIFNRASPVPLIGVPFKIRHPAKAEDLPDIDVVIISHDHYDHLDHKAIKALKHKAKHFLVPLGLAAHLEYWGIAADKVSEFDWYEGTSLFGINFTLTPTRHFSGRGLSNRFSTLWGAWVVQSADLNVYFSGDTGYFDEFKKVGEKFGPFDIAFIENGAYNLNWANVHMMPEQSVQASIDLQARVFFPIHWSKFDLSVHIWDEPANRAAAHAEKLGVTMASPLIGEIFSPDAVPQERWWKTIEP